MSASDVNHNVVYMYPMILLQIVIKIMVKSWDSSCEKSRVLVQNQ